MGNARSRLDAVWAADATGLPGLAAVQKATVLLAAVCVPCLPGTCKGPALSWERRLAVAMHDAQSSAAALAPNWDTSITDRESTVSMPDIYRSLKCIPFSRLIGPNRFISLNRLFAFNRINPVFCYYFDCTSTQWSTTEEYRLNVKQFVSTLQQQQQPNRTRTPGPDTRRWSARRFSVVAKSVHYTAAKIFDSKNSNENQTRFYWKKMVD